MQTARPLPLNAVRAFEAVARSGSIKLAAMVLGVTPSAVSHQIRQLEEAAGTRLFQRRNNGLDLTAKGRRLFESISPALATIARAGQDIRNDEPLVVMVVSTSLALCWLIPRLQAFRLTHPRIRVSLETVRLPAALAPGVDVAISYARRGAGVTNAVHLLADRGRPVASPLLPSRNGGGARATRFIDAPLISGSADDWDWQAWSQANGIDFSELRIVDRFDTDHAAVAACVAGMGVFMPSSVLIERELRNGTLVPWGDFPEHHFGDYWLFTAAPLRKPVETLVSWLLNVARTS